MSGSGHGAVCFLSVIISSHCPAARGGRCARSALPLQRKRVWKLHPWPPEQFGPLRFGGDWGPPLAKGQTISRAPQPCPSARKDWASQQREAGSPAGLGPRGKRMGRMRRSCRAQDAAG